MKHVYFLLLALLACACNTVSVNDSWWSSPEAWYDNGKEVNPEYVDVFYLNSTNVVSSHDSLGNISYTALLTDEERQPMAYEMNSANTKMFPDSLNFFAPFYHQYTLDAIDLPLDEQEAVYRKVIDEVADSFRYYMEHMNGGRRFILAGFSQGAMLVVELLKRLSPEELSRMVVSYVIGFKVTAEDMECGNIVPCADPCSNGVTVCFNSVASPDAVWDFVNGGAAFCTNPVTWSSDTETAEFDYYGHTLTVRVDPEVNALVVGGIDPAEYTFEMLDKYVKPGNLHHWDAKFYRPYILRNALLRSYGE